MENDTPAVKEPNPFNPGSPVDPNDFVGRTTELENFRQRLRQTARGSLASMAVAGGYGIGKTSFLYRCKTIAETEGALAIYFSMNELEKASKYELAKILIERVRDKVQEEVILKRLSETAWQVLQHIKISTGTVGIRLETPASGDTSYPNLQAALKSAWQALRGSHAAIVFLIDEAGVLERNRGELLLYLRAVLEQLHLEKIPIMFVPAGKLSISGPTGTGFSPLVRTFPPAVLYNFTSEETSSFITRKLGKMGIRMDPGTIDRAYTVTEGHPYVLAAYLHTVYSKMSASEKEITLLHLEAAEVEFVSSVLAKFFSRFYDDVGKSSRDILRRIAEKPTAQISLSELSESMKKNNNHLSPFLARLVQDGALLREDRGRYRLFHHLLADYIRKSGKAAG